MKSLIFTISIVFLLIACKEKVATPMADEPHDRVVNTDEVKAQIDSANEVFSVAIAKGDSATVVALYHPDADVFPPNMEKGKPKMMGSMASQSPAMGITSAKLEAKEIYAGDETVTEVGEYQFSVKDKTLDKGKYIVIWKKDGDKWKLFRDIWNSDMGAPHTK